MRLLLRQHILLLIFLIGSCMAQWNLVLPPDSARTNLVGLFPYTESGTSMVVAAFRSGELYEVNLSSDGIEVIHTNNNLVTSLSNAPQNYYNTDLTSVCLGGYQNTLYAQATDALYYINMGDAQGYRTWYKKTGLAPVAAAKLLFMIPITSEQSSDLLCFWDSGLVNMVQPIYGTNITVGNLPTLAKPSAVLYSDSLAQKTEILQQLIIVGTDVGSLSVFSTVVGGGFAMTNFSVGAGYGRVSQILHYRSGSMPMLIWNTGPVTGRGVLFFSFPDPTTGIFQAPKTSIVLATNMTIFSDALLHDWLIFSNSVGIYKLDLTEVTLANIPTPILISASFNALGSSSITVALLSSFMSVLDRSTNTGKVIPVVIAVAKYGAISVLRGDSYDWIQIANPLDFTAIGNYIVSADIVESDPSELFREFKFIIVLDTGAILTRSVDSYTFTKGTMATNDEHYTVQVPQQPVNHTGGFETTALSLNQLQSLIQEDRPTILIFSDSNGNKVEYQLLGFELESVPQRQDSPKIKLALADTAITRATLKYHKLGFFPAILEAIELAYEVCVWGADLWDIGVEFYYTATSIYDKFVAEDI